MKSFMQLSFDLGKLEAGVAEEACFGCGAISVTLVDAQDDPVLEPLPGEVRLWPTTRVQALFAGDRDLRPLIESLSTALQRIAAQFTAEPIADCAWERQWLRDFHATRFGRRLWICPHHETVAQSDAIVVRMDPGMAFGTGTHPTTALCLEWLDRGVAAGERIIDYGCGSGILAIAAAKLGATAAYCFDIDPQALLATADNAKANDVQSRVRICAAADTLPRGVDLLVANILCAPLCALATVFHALVRPGGRIVLSGLLDQQIPEVTRAYGACFDIHPFEQREGWVGLSGTRQ